MAQLNVLMIILCMQLLLSAISNVLKIIQKDIESRAESDVSFHDFIAIPLIITLLYTYLSSHR